MPSSDDLPHLLRLLDDDSPVVQAEIQRAFRGLVNELQQLSGDLTAQQRARLDELLEPLAREELLAQWPDWRSQESNKARLEFGLDRIARYQNGVLSKETLGEVLDELALEFRKHYPHTNDPMDLANFLFKDRHLVGDRDTYYHPRNSNLISVLRKGTGNPISLTCLYILAGGRASMKVEGCNYPGHFLARVVNPNSQKIVDCFRGGQVLETQLTDSLQQADALKEPASAQTILCRVLRNLINSYRRLEDTDRADFFVYLFKLTLHEHTTDDGPPDFSLGQLVEHRRYGYRGVVVDYDLICLADDEWYSSNRTQPDRNQPWYRVLVDRSDKITYAAQNSLKPDTKGDRVTHPLIEAFFSRFNGDSYERNGRPWPRSRP